jgi:transposase
VTTLLAGLSLTGMSPAMTVEGGTTAAVFATFLERVLIPALRPGQLVVVDNVGAHKPEQMHRLVEAAGCELLFLPAYSPDLSPVEEAFSRSRPGSRRPERAPAPPWTARSPPPSTLSPPPTPPAGSPTPATPAHNPPENRCQSPQLDPDDEAVLPRESGLSRLWLQLALLYLSAVGPHAVGGFAGQGRHDVALSVHCRAHLAVAEHLLDEPRVFLSMGQP